MRTISFLVAAALLTTAVPSQLRPCAFRAIRPTCGPILVGSDHIISVGRTEFHLIAFHASNAPVNGIGVLAFGNKQIKVQFPGTRCFLLTDVRATWAIPFHTNAHGNASIAFRVPGKLSGVIYAQSAFVNRRRQLTTSNALQIGCR